MPLFLVERIPKENHLKTLGGCLPCHANTVCWMCLHPVYIVPDSLPYTFSPLYSFFPDLLCTLNVKGRKRTREDNPRASASWLSPVQMHGLYTNAPVICSHCPPPHLRGWVGDSGANVRAVTFWVPPQCWVSVGLVVLCKYTPIEFTVIKSGALTLSRSPQCRAFSRAVIDET